MVAERLHMRRVPIILLAVLSLLVGVWAGLRRMEWPLADLDMPIELFHGALMVSGFLGALISLERAVAMGGGWRYASPLLAVVGAMGLASGVLPGRVGIGILVAAAILMSVMTAPLVRSARSLHTVLLLVGALSWAAGNGLWLLGWPLYHVFLFWIGFPVITIAGERLELSRFAPSGPWAEGGLGLWVALYLAGASAIRGEFDSALRWSGVALAGIAAVLFWIDIARRTVRRPGQPRFIALAVLGGYGWLALSGAVAALSGEAALGAPYDIILHGVFVGYVLSMVFAHSLIIFPAVTGAGMAFHRGFYVPLIVLHLSLAARGIGGLALVPSLRTWGGMGNAAAILLFFGCAAGARILARRQTRNAELPTAVR